MCTTEDTLPAGPASNRIWTDDDVCAYYRVATIEVLMNHWPNFPRPLPVKARGRRWHPAQHLKYFNWLADWSEQQTGALAEGDETPPEAVVAEVDITDVAADVARIQRRARGEAA